MTGHKSRKTKEGGGNNEAQEADDHARLQVRVVYQVIRQEGEEQMERPAASLWWSGLAAGLSISFSLLAQALLLRALPHAEWSQLVVGFGYSVGFLMVVLARQQLFTESTITVILPLLAHPTRRNGLLSLRMWALVLCANIAGTFVSAIFCTFAPVISPEIHTAMLEISRHALAYDWWQMLFRGISAGFLIAVMVWLIPSADGAEFHIVVVMTYLVAIGGFAHIVAGSMEAFMMVLAGEQSAIYLLWNFAIPVLLGNIIGGTVLFGVLSYAQVMHEL
jgi:formate/nitrite transporter FocA (FNT family)